MTGTHAAPPADGVAALAVPSIIVVVAMADEAGIITVDLVPLAASQRALIGQLDREQGSALMAALDACNARFGRGAVVPARAGLERARAGWSTKFEMRTPRYTTQIGELPVAWA